MFPPVRRPPPRRGPLLSLDDEFFDGVTDPPPPAEVVPVTRPPREPDPPPADPTMVGFDIDETTVLGPPSPNTARGWAWRADKVLSPKSGKTLRDEEGRMRFSRAEFLRVAPDVLRMLAAYGLQVDPSRIPWGAFRDEVETYDREADWERLRSWLDER